MRIAKFSIAGLLLCLLLAACGGNSPTSRAKVHRKAHGTYYTTTLPNNTPTPITRTGPSPGTIMSVTSTSPTTTPVGTTTSPATGATTSSSSATATASPKSPAKHLSSVAGKEVAPNAPKATPKVAQTSAQVTTQGALAAAKAGNWAKFCAYSDYLGLGTPQRADLSGCVGEYGPQWVEQKLSNRFVGSPIYHPVDTDSEHWVGVYTGKTIKKPYQEVSWGSVGFILSKVSGKWLIGSVAVPPLK